MSPLDCHHYNYQRRRRCCLESPRWQCERKEMGVQGGGDCLLAASLLNHPFCFHPPLAFLKLPGSIVQKDLHTCCPSPKMRPVIELQVPARQDPESNPYWKGNLIWVPLAGRHLFELRTGGGYHYQDLWRTEPRARRDRERQSPYVCIRGREREEGMQFVKYMRHLCSHYLNTMCRNFATQLEWIGG